MKLRLEVWSDPQRERLLIDGDEIVGAEVELAFPDASSGSMTVAELVGRFKRHVEVKPSAPPST